MLREHLQTFQKQVVDSVLHLIIVVGGENVAQKLI